MMKKKEIINELETLYAIRLSNYEALMQAEKYEEAQHAYNDCTETLVKIFEIKKLKSSDVKNYTEAAVGAVSTGAFTYLGVKSFKFEENGTISSTGGKSILSESFRRLSPPKV